jgi:hypothetical protein
LICDFNKIHQITAYKEQRTTDSRKLELQKVGKELPKSGKRIHIHHGATEKEENNGTQINTEEHRSIHRRDAKSAENGSLMPMWRLPNGEISGLVSPFFSLHIPPLLAQFQPLRGL